MNCLFVGTEAKVFCVLIILFLWFLQTGNPQPEWAGLRYVYLFSAAAGILSILQRIVHAFAGEMYVHNLLSLAAAIGYGLTAYFWGNYACGMKKFRLTISKHILLLFGAVIVGVVAAFLLSLESNSLLYITTFAAIIVFVTSQNNKIKIDNLTKLYNRYGMDEEIREQLQQYENDRNNSFYIIACDLDNFKHINDTWGHQEGDRALVLVASALSRAGKLFGAEVFRIGGDEFVIITDTSEKDLATKVMDAVESELDSIDFRDDFDIEISMGVAFYDGNVQIDELLNNADKKLYQAKRRSKRL